MKKFLSVILALVTMFSIGTMAFAHENVDNTFDNFTPGPGVQAPDNWYDPYCYDADGLIVTDCFSAKYCTYYCKEAKKIYTNYSQTVPGGTGSYIPYLITDETAEYGHSEYCPYCGRISDIIVGLQNNNNQPDYSKTHIVINDVYYGYTCKNCGLFPVGRVMSSNGIFGCTNCWIGNEPEKIYRFIPKAYETAEFAHIFNESEHKFGDGQDGYIEDVGQCEYGYLGWNPGSSDEPAELTFWQKIVKFFTDIGIWFANLFSF